MLISPSRAQEEETRARVTRAEQESLSLHVPREKKRRFGFVSLNSLFFVPSLCSARDDAEGNGETFTRQ
jgi:hypothetical protein